MSKRVTRSVVKDNPDNYTHCSLSPVGIKKKKRRKSLFNLTGQETHLAGVTKCQRVKDETVLELNEMKCEMQAEYSKLGYADPARGTIKQFVDSIEAFLRDGISKTFNKIIITALYPPEGAATIPSITDIERAWSLFLPQLKAMRGAYKELVLLRDNQWQAHPTRTAKVKKTPKKGGGRGRRKRREVEEDKENIVKGRNINKARIAREAEFFDFATAFGQMKA